MERGLPNEWALKVLARATGGALAMLSLAGAGCRASPAVETRTVTLHVPAACAVGASPYAIAQAAGDFEPTSSPAAFFVSEPQASLDFPALTRSLTLDVTDASSARWQGRTKVAATGDVSLLLLPYRGACAFSGDVAARAGGALGVFGERLLLSGGSAVGGGGGGEVPASVQVDLTTGALVALPAGLLVPRTFAAVTAFGAGALVAGGASSAGVPLASAEVFAGADFDGAPIALSVGRAEPAATTLVSGETLLAGGRGDMGPLSSLEVVDPALRRARTEGLAALDVARTAAKALRLASGEILIAGGLDASGAPVPTLEWLTSDARKHARLSRDLVVGRARDYVALAAGGALAVIAPSDASASFRSVWVIDGEGTLEAAPPLGVPLDTVQLFEGGGGAPALWTGRAWLLWDPWGSAFVPLATATASADGPGAGSMAVAAAPGLATWLTGARLSAFRFSSRDAYSTPSSLNPEAPLLVTDATSLAPDGLGARFPFDSAAGLTLPEGGNAFVTDATFQDFGATWGVPSGILPAVVLREADGTEIILDRTTCPFVDEGSGAAAPSMQIERTGAKVRAGAFGAPRVDCAVTLGADDRVQLGFRGVARAPSGALASVRALLVTRR